jgi:hypothetical protein
MQTAADKAKESLQHAFTLAGLDVTDRVASELNSTVDHIIDACVQEVNHRNMQDCLSED